MWYNWIATRVALVTTTNFYLIASGDAIVTIWYLIASGDAFVTSWFATGVAIDTTIWSAVAPDTIFWFATGVALDTTIWIATCVAFDTTIDLLL